MGNKTPNWKAEMYKFDKGIRNEESRNRQAMRKLKNYMGHTDGADNNTYSVNSLSGDPQLERECGVWRQALRDLKK